MGLSYSQRQIGSYVVVLSEVKGQKKIPIIIKPSDAQYIAMKIESIKSSLPMIHDLMKGMVDTLSATVREIVIDNFIEGVFYCKIVLKDINGEKHILHCGAGDAIALSLSFDCQLYVTKNILDEAGVIISDDGTVLDDENEITIDEEKDEKISLESLQKMLEDALENEEYEIASQLRDKIKDMKAEEK